MRSLDDVIQVLLAEDDASTLVWGAAADWLDDHSMTARAEFVRAVIAATNAMKSFTPEVAMNHRQMAGGLFIPSQSRDARFPLSPGGRTSQTQEWWRQRRSKLVGTLAPMLILRWIPSPLGTWSFRAVHFGAVLPQPQPWAYPLWTRWANQIVKDYWHRGLLWWCGLGDRNEYLQKELKVEIHDGQAEMMGRPNGRSSRVIGFTAMALSAIRNRSAIGPEYLDSPVFIGRDAGDTREREMEQWMLAAWLDLAYRYFEDNLIKYEPFERD